MLIGVDASRVTRPRRTGTEHYTLQVLREMLRLDTTTDYRLYLSTDLPAGLLPDRPRTEQRVIRLPRLWTQVGLSAEMLRRPPDLLFVPSHVLPLVLPRRRVVVIYDVGHRFFPRAHAPAEWLYVEWAVRRQVRVADAILTISRAAKTDLARLYGADPRRVAVAYPAVDARFSPSAVADLPRVRAAYGLPARYVLHVGVVKPRKNLGRLVRAFALADLPPDVALVLAGPAGPAEQVVAREIERLGLADRVRRIPYVEGADLPAVYAGALCSTVVSLHEGFGIPALEAMACGAPTIVSGRGSLPEVAADAALLVNPLDVGSIAHALRRLADDAALAERLAAAGPDRASHFTWPAAARTTLDVLAAVGDGRPLALSA